MLQLVGIPRCHDNKYGTPMASCPMPSLFLAIFNHLKFLGRDSAPCLSLGPLVDPQGLMLMGQMPKAGGGSEDSNGKTLLDLAMLGLSTDDDVSGGLLQPATSWLCHPRVRCISLGWRWSTPALKSSMHLLHCSDPLHLTSFAPANSHLPTLALLYPSTLSVPPSTRSIHSTPWHQQARKHWTPAGSWCRSCGQSLFSRRLLAVLHQPLTHPSTPLIYPPFHSAHFLLSHALLHPRPAWQMTAAGSWCQSSPKPLPTAPVPFCHRQLLTPASTPLTHTPFCSTRTAPCPLLPVGPPGS